jgi:trigger factor
MQYKYEAAEKSTVKITIQFDAKEWQDAINKSYAKNKSRYRVNGFRPGKAPRSVIENFYGKGAFYEGAFNELYNAHYFEILEKEKDNFTAVGEPALSVDDLSDNGVTLIAQTPVKPDVAIETYKGIKIKEYVYNVKDEDVDAEVKKVQERNARQVDVTDRAAANGDICNIDFSGKVDGKKFEGGTAEGYALTLGSNTFIPGFEPQIVGMNIGESKDITVTFPAEYQVETLKGKEAIFTVKLNGIKVKELPEVTDEFIKDATGSETLDAYKAKAKERLQKQADKKSRDDTENSIISAICEKTTAEIPEAMIQAQVDSILQNVDYQLSYQGLDLNTYLEYLHTTKEAFGKQYEEQAKKNVLSQLVIEKIIKLEGIGATEAEIDEKIAAQAKDVEKTFEEYKKNMDERQKQYITQDLVLSKLFDFLKQNNEMYVEA